MDFFGLTQPDYDFVLIALILVVATALSFALDNPFISGGLILVMYLAGFGGFIFRGGTAAYALLIMALLYTIYYILRNFIHWGGKRHG